MLLTFLGTTFSGCTKYVYLKCQTPKPIRTEYKQCSTIKDDFQFAQCVSSKHITLEGDYDSLEVAFDSCK